MPLKSPDDDAGQGGSYLRDPESGQRTLVMRTRPRPASPRDGAAGVQTSAPPEQPEQPEQPSSPDQE